MSRRARSRRPETLSASFPAACRLRSSNSRSSSKAVVPRPEAGAGKCAAEIRWVVSPPLQDSRMADRLERYRQMRDFSLTPEPRGGKRAARDGLHFYVQRHAATRLHYDFRL